MTYTKEELDECALDDWRRDAEAAERYAHHAVDEAAKSSWLTYAEECRQNIAMFKNGGAHQAMLKA